MALGNTWVYEDKESGIISTVRIEGVVMFDDRPWHLFRYYEREVDQPADQDEPIGFDSWHAFFNGHEYDAEVSYDEEAGALELAPLGAYFRYPAKAGDSYRPNPLDETTVMTVIAVGEKVKTKAGEFECIVYKETYADEPGLSYMIYVAPGVGVVKDVESSEEGTYTSELVSYKPGG